MSLRPSERARGTRRFAIAAATTLVLVTAPLRPAVAAWPALGGAGVPVCEAPGYPAFPSIAPDGSGGVYLTWIDRRDGFTASPIYVQHVTGDGVLAWTPNGIALGSARAAEHVVVTDGAGGAIVVWRDFRADTAGNVYAQRLDPNGTFLWGPGGVPISLGARHEVSIAAAGDGAGGAWIAWRDDRDFVFTIRVQRVNQDGTLAWPADGIVAAPNGASQTAPRVAGDGQGGMLAAWTQQSGGVFSAFAQRWSGSGSPLWTTTGVAVSTSPFGVMADQVAADGGGGMLVSLRDDRSQNTWQQAFAQRIDASGAVAWATDGVSLSGPQWPVFATFICSDEAGGAFAGWHDYRNGPNGILAQRISGAGAKTWAPAGELVATPIEGGGWMNVRMLPDGAGGVVFAWNEGIDGTEYSAWAQRVGSNGAPQWTAGGVLLATVETVMSQFVAAPDGQGGAVGAWIDRHGFVTNSSLGAQRVGADGTLDVPSPLGDSKGILVVPTPAHARTGVELRFVPGTSLAGGVDVFDVTGRLVKSLAPHSGGSTVHWDGLDAGGRTCGAGLYWARARGGSESVTARIVIVD